MGYQIGWRAHDEYTGRARSLCMGVCQLDTYSLHRSFFLDRSVRGHPCVWVAMWLSILPHSNQEAFNMDTLVFLWLLIVCVAVLVDLIVIQPRNTTGGR